MRTGIKIKTPDQIKRMQEGGKKLSLVKEEVRKEVREGKNASEIDALAEKLILKAGGRPSFKMVPGYFWTTCVNINDGIVHGIPREEIVFKKGDVVSVDLGMYYKGLHTDTSFTVGIAASPEVEKMLSVGEESLYSAIKRVRAGARIYDLSEAIEKVLTTGGYSPVRALVGHGIGEELHEDPQIPCFTAGRREDSPEMVPGLALAIEVMYAQGSGEVYLKEDRWTIATHDGKISALFEETVIVTKNGSLVVT